MTGGAHHMAANYLPTTEVLATALSGNSTGGCSRVYKGRVYSCRVAYNSASCGTPWPAGRWDWIRWDWIRPTRALCSCKERQSWTNPSHPTPPPMPRRSCYGHWRSTRHSWRRQERGRASAGLERGGCRLSIASAGVDPCGSLPIASRSLPQDPGFRILASGSWLQDPSCMEGRA